MTNLGQNMTQLAANQTYICYGICWLTYGVLQQLEVHSTIFSSLPISVLKTVICVQYTTLQNCV
jgi:uncharacterized protein with PQ loop repeat